MEEVGNEIPRSEDEDEEVDDNSEGLPDRDIDKVEHPEDVNNSMETKQKEIDDTNEEAEVENNSTPDPVISTIESARESSSTTEMNNEIPGRVESENDSGEDSNEDEEHSEEIKGTELHHQSSTVTSNVGMECDDGLRTDGDGKCVGE